MHVLDPRLGGWAARMRGWAREECDGRRLPASPEQLEEEERDNAYDKAGSTHNPLVLAGPVCPVHIL